MPDRESHPNAVATAHLRIARPTDQLESVVAFYRDGVGFAELGRFVDHDGFDGVMLGHPQSGYHLEFTHQRGHCVGTAPNKDHLIVFYLPEQDSWNTSVARMKAFGCDSIPSFNPYWDRNGVTFEDPDGYRVVFQNARWTP